MTMAVVFWIVLVMSPSGAGVTALYPTETQCVEGRKELQALSDVFLSDCVSVPVQLTAGKT